MYYILQAQVFRECLDNFPSKLEEVTFAVVDQAMRIKSYYDAGQGVRDGKEY
jgi:hypothetical protein